MQLRVNEIALAQHILALTSGSSVSVLFFLAPHGMCRRDQEKCPAGIVRHGNQRTERGAGPYQRLQSAMWAGHLDACTALQEPYSITLYDSFSTSKAKYNMEFVGNWKSKLLGWNCDGKSRAARGRMKSNSKVFSWSMEAIYSRKSVYWKFSGVHFADNNTFISKPQHGCKSRTHRHLNSKKLEKASHWWR